MMHLLSQNLWRNKNTFVGLSLVSGSAESMDLSSTSMSR